MFYLEQPLGGADPALVGGCVRPVLSFNTNEEEGGVGGGEEHSVRQQRTSIRDQLRHQLLDPGPGSWGCVVSWQTSSLRPALLRDLKSQPADSAQSAMCKWSVLGSRVPPSGAERTGAWGQRSSLLD